MANFISHDCYCIYCGNKGISVVRNNGRMRKKGHLKNLYCVYCRRVTRHYEVYDNEDKDKFIEKFNKGDFINDIETDKTACGMSSVWENVLRS